MAILTFAGKDATAEFDIIHPLDVVDKYAPDAVIGILGEMIPPKKVTPWKRWRSTTRKVICGWS